MAPPPMMVDPPVAAEDGEFDNEDLIIQTLKPTKSFHAKSLGEGEKTGVQVRNET